MPSDRPSPLPRWVKVLLWTGLALFLGWLGWVQLIRDETVRAPEGFLARPENVVFQPEENGLELIRELEFIRTPQGDWRQHKQQQEILKLRAPWIQEVMQPLVDAAPAVERLVQQTLQKPTRPAPPQADRSDPFPWSPEEDFSLWYSGDDFKRATNIFLAKALDLARQNKGMEARRWITEARNMALRYRAVAGSPDRSKLAMHFLVQTDFLVFHQLAGYPASAEDLAEAPHLFTGTGFLHEAFLRLVARDYGQQMEYRAQSRKNSGNQADPMQLLPMCCEGPMPPDWWIRTRYKQGAEQNCFTDIYSQLGGVIFLESPKGRQRVADLYAALKIESKLSLLSLEPNRTGRVLASTAALRLLDDESWFFAIEALRRCCLTAVAAKRWSLAHEGHRPGSLQELVPDYLPGVPLDPYEARPVRWDAASGTVYVIGEAGVDDVPVMPAGRFVSLPKTGAGARLP